jgi:hypothetical protein
MNKTLIVKVAACFFLIGYCLYSYIDKQNEITSLKMKIPQIIREANIVKEENKRLSYEIGIFEDPSNLLRLASNPEFSHLKHPLIKDIFSMPEGVALKIEKDNDPYFNKKIFSLAIGAK